MDNESHVLIDNTRQCLAQLVQQKQRGVPTDKEELFAWRNTNKFIHLPPRGQEAFFKFLRGSKYSEDKDIIDIDVRAEGMTNDARRYQFWLKTKGMDLSNLFEIYISDDETKLPDVNDCLTKHTNESEYLKEKVRGAEKVDGFVQELKDMMEPKLDQSFTDFKKSLENTYGKNGENIK
ncbi:uncharacterized protein [Procambarus clarkii]|uniref:uncharacterized protein isoform X2 n=1 Tax=Procambarus clarkii TaxID=6728 RepID=UPI003743EDA5